MPMVNTARMGPPTAPKMVREACKTPVPRNLTTKATPMQRRPKKMEIILPSLAAFASPFSVKEGVKG